ncbi:MAG TPA: DUF6314 family protein [Chlamydiales bacterium]|nr:DUF6314 family protein [Chlamydiales bacterium]
MTQTIFNHFEGSWQFKRITPHGKMIGVARFTNKTPNELHYREEGLFIRETIPKVSSEDDNEQYTHKIFQEYIYRLENDKIVIYFNEKPPRLFHRLEFTDDSQAFGFHLCKSDQYEAFFHFESPEKFTVTYLVKGPKKNYTINTTFQKYVKTTLPGQF